MAFKASWAVKDADKPVKEIRYEKVPESTFLLVQFKTADKAHTAHKKLQSLDQYCDLQGDTIVLGDGITPEDLGTFLEGNAMIDAACLSELNTEMREYRGGPPRSGKGRRF